MEPRKINTALLFLNTLGRFPVAVHFMMMIRVILMRPTTRILPQEAFHDDDDDDDKGEVDEAYNTGFTPGSI